MYKPEKLAMHTPNLADANFLTLAALFPNAVTETIDNNGQVVRAIDADVLRQEISTAVVEGPEERYQFTWPDKKKSVLLANAPIAATLRLCREESEDFENTENLYIEGDNLDVLKLLRETYLNRVKMIYIDPPYNTGKDFIYEDDFAENSGEFLHRDGQFDEQGNRLTPNLDSNGRFHTDWLNMMYPRLCVMMDILTDDGVIFISIGDKEAKNLRKICDEIFGERNFIATIIWERSYAPISLKKHFSDNHDYILCFAKNVDNLVCNGLPRPDSTNAKYSNPDNDPRGLWRTDNLSVGPVVPEKVYEIVTPSGRKVWPPKGRCWIYTKERYKEMVADNRIWFGEKGDNVPAPKRFLSEVKQGLTPMTIWKFGDVGHNQEAMRELRDLFGGEKVFDYSKPVRLIKQMISLYTQDTDIVLDFFSGSGTTAQAVMQLNSEDGGNRKFIMVQLPEPCDEKSEAYKAGYKNICEIGKERIRRAGKKIKEESPLTTADLDTGFRVLKLDSSNMKDVYYTPDKYDNSLFDQLTDNIKEDRTPEDLLFQVMLDLGILLSCKIEQREIGGKQVFFVNDNYLIACFDSDISDDVVKEIAQLKPYYAVFRDSSFATDSVAVNFEQIFATYSPSTVRRVL